MSEAREKELNARALDPAASVVIEACAGSGKTWMLVSRIVRLLLAGAAPSQILAITFTRKAAQEMATRLRDWLFELAIANDEAARKFLRDRAVPESEIETLLPKARQLYERFLTAQPQITIATFHSWFLQLLRRAPLDAGAPGDVSLVEHTSSLVGDAWEVFASRAQRDRDSPAARGLDYLFGKCGLDNTRRLLTRFLHRRADWQAYTRGQKDPVAFALERIRGEMGVAPDADVIGPLMADAAFQNEVADYAALLERNTPTDGRLAALLTEANPDAARRFMAICAAVLTDNGKGDLRSRKASPTQAKRLGAEGEARLLDLHARLGARLVEARAQLADQASYRFNEAALNCGVALLEAYQHAKAERQVIDYADIEWRAWELVSESEHAVYMHYKLDARYRHVLLDEFQDTNPLQWLTLKSWLEAAAAADLRPSVFMVGDPKQSIYRFRRAETRLFAQAAGYLEAEFGARRLPQDESRRCPPAVIEAVNRVFSGEPAFEGFEKHAAHYGGKPGRVEVLPLVEAEAADVAAREGLRNPLQEKLEVKEDRRREHEAGILVEKIRSIHGRWQVATDLAGGKARPAEYRDFMILVRRRTHLEVYERALRHAGIPFVTSRQGGLLDTLEAQDLVALLEFLVSPFADLKLAHALRSPVFACADEDLVAIAEAGERGTGGTWWERLQRIAASGSPALKRARELLERWLGRTDSAPVHDQLDRIYFEGDVMRRYEAAVPAAMRDGVLANLQAFMQRALDVDSGRYPSLPRFLHELADLREAPPEEAPDEGIGGDAGNAVRIYTVHGAKGLQSPIVWILDAAAGQDAGRGYEALVDWPPDAEAPRAFSLWPRKDAQSAAQKRIAEEEARLAAREDLNLLYVAMTRAQQVLIVSGSEGRGADRSWHSRLGAALGADTVLGNDLADTQNNYNNQIFKSDSPMAAAVSSKLAQPLPTGARAQVLAGRGLEYGTHFHHLMDCLTRGGAAPDRAVLAAEAGLSAREFDAMWSQAQALIAAPALARYYDAKRFRRAANEVAYVDAAGELRRIDRLVEFDDEICVLDYKSGTADEALAAQYAAQVAEYRDAAKLLYPGKKVNGLIVFSDGTTKSA